MKETLSLFHTTLGVIKTRKVLQAAGVCSWVADISRGLRGGCGLCIYIDCVADKEDGWIIPDYTKSVYHLENGDWHCLAIFPPS